MDLPCIPTDHMIKALPHPLGPGPPGMERAARWAGGLWHALDGRHRRIAEANIRLALGCDAGMARSLAKANFVHLARVVLESALLYRVNRQNYARFVTVRGLEHLEDSFSRGKGALCLTGHWGNWEWLAYCAPFFLTRPINVVVRPLQPEWLNRLVRRLRARSGNRIIERRNASKAILKALANNEAVGILFDHNAKRRMAIDAPFFGKYVPTNRGLALLALKSGAPVHPVFNRRTACGGFCVEFHRAVPLPAGGSTEERIRIATERFNQCLEAQIRKDPSQWFWVYRRFRKYRETPS